MIALALRELRVAARGPLAAAAAAQVALLAVVVAGWGTGHPLDAKAFGTAFRTVQIVGVAVFLPWIVTRATADDGRTAFVQLSLVAGVPAHELMTARLLAVGVASLTAAAATMPVAILAGRIAPPADGLLVDQVTIAVLAFAVAPLTLLCGSLKPAGTGAITTWIATTVATGVIGIVLLRTATPFARLATLVAVIVVALAALFTLTRQTLAHLSEPAQ